MPVLKNQRWERLAQELAQNKTASEAMILAGYSDVRNSTRLTKKDLIRRRIEELKSRGAERAEVSIASLLGELEAAREKASNFDQLSAAVRAIEAKAKVSGLLVQNLKSVALAISMAAILLKPSLLRWRGTWAGKTSRRGIRRLHKADIRLV